MARPGYLSIYADQKTQQIFNEFTRIKGIKKTTALTEMLELYMLLEDEDLYLALKKDILNVDKAKHLLALRDDSTEINDFLFMKLGNSYDEFGNIIDSKTVLTSYANNSVSNELNYTWFSTNALHWGMSAKKVAYYNSLVSAGKDVKILFALDNEIVASANILEIASDRSGLSCPGVPGSVPDIFSYEENAKIWLKLTNFVAETTLKAAMFKIRTTGANLKQVITDSQFHFGYVYIASETL